MTEPDLNDAVPDDLNRAVELMRQSPEPSAAWRDGVVRAAVAANATGAHASPARPWRARVLIPLAAAFAGGVIGAWSVYAVMRRDAIAAPIVVSALPAASSEVRVKFTYDAPTASTVSIVGDFNQWRPGGVPLRHSANGKSWEIEIPLTPGRYVYSYLVDGKLARDPSAPQVRDDDFGSPSSVVMVKGS